MHETLFSDLTVCSRSKGTAVFYFLNIDLDNMLSVYHRMGLSQKEMQQFLANQHRVCISSSTLKRRLKNLKLFKRKLYSDIIDVAIFI